MSLRACFAICLACAVAAATAAGVEPSPPRAGAAPPRTGTTTPFGNGTLRRDTPGRK